MAEENKQENELNFDAQAIETIASRAVLEVDGVLTTQGNAFNTALSQAANWADQVKEKAQESFSDEEENNEQEGQHDQGEAEGHEEGDHYQDGVNAEVGKVEVAVDLDIVVAYGKEIPKIFDEIVENVNKRIHEATGLEVVEVNVNVRDIMTEEEYRKVHYKQFPDN
ncbi:MULTISPECIES: Asp23/Gls24 family envelope stress response protein [Aerococcus]|uniref:Stress response regulator gls24 homolog n=1 Tax=Aerococcus sanguinicola TaxID=119206 RepID=A0A5N1GH71_9LACT|nr:MULTISPECIES: Asp23/Gls24 family envelope stress response protein [Aerococcus]KAA9299718.1 Asp23/Gls24 family envelope stress response protein [Aerococcus sanguinicola]MDK6369918.1 Asp23/Gls24 family envelope stress response protein [Aerococcus sp. UMB9870]MDK6680608.1 Asp23/Gls24 family envelope stress response protein [Aerococcus sp. UMB8608]MDK6687335.1 Asp23/Gls24 family envelope stress response protein [Aerococcus sp. UMB8623]MDK6940558.1 Asp23/Gls24 family envelope stress response pro